MLWRKHDVLVSHMVRATFSQLRIRLLYRIGCIFTEAAPAVKFETIQRKVETWYI